MRNERNNLRRTYTLGREFDPGKRDFSHYRTKNNMPNGRRTIKLLLHQIRLHGRRGKRLAESFSRERLTHAPQKEVDSKYRRTSLLCDPAGTSNELHVQNGCEENNTHTHTIHTKSKENGNGSNKTQKLRKSYIYNSYSGKKGVLPRALFLSAILLVVLPVTFGHTTVCRSPPFTSSAAFLH